MTNTDVGRRGILLLPALLAVLAACGNEAPQRDAPQDVPAKAEVKIAQSELGPILVDQMGRTLYGFTKDKDKSSACDTDCVAVWPALTAESTVDAKDGADSKLVTQIDESSQAVYGEWFAIAADGKLVKKS